MRLKQKGYRLLFRLSRFLCGVYAKLAMSKDEPSDNLMTFFSRMFFFSLHGYWPHIKKPRTFSEKTFHRMLYSRDSKLTLVSDKLLVRDYVKEKVGDSILIPLLWKGKNPKDIPYEILPTRFVIKTNHGCQYNIFITDKESVDKKAIEDKLNKWLKTNYFFHVSKGFTWGYKNIEPMILIEAFLEENQNPPLDYKFFCFSGRVEFLLITYDRFSYHREKHFTRDFVPLDLWNGSDQYPGPFVRPIGLDKMIDTSEVLSTEFDFVRVDLYNIKGKIYFGELTCYPAGGWCPFKPRTWDFVFGEKWEIK